jgi:hypothetical protein
MRIVRNTSGYCSRELRSLLCLVHREIQRTEKRSCPGWKHLRVLVRGRDRGLHVTGRAVLTPGMAYP